MDDAAKALLRKMTADLPATADDARRLEWLQDQIQAYRRYLPERVIEKIKIDPKAKRLEGERRIVTIAFADLSGFTALSETMDAEDIAAVINDFFTRMVRIVFKYGGSVDKFLGDALMVLFGAPVAHQDDPERAIRACLEMQAEMDRFNEEKKFDPPLGMSIGVNTGPVVALNVGSDERMEYTVIGDAVNLAARLEAVSTRGEIIISRSTYEKVSEVVDAERRPAVKVKGKRKPIVIYLVQGIREHYRLPEIRRLPYVGREAEQKEARSGLAQAQAGRFVLLGITGDAGAGKTRLAAEIESEARQRGFCVLSGRGLPYEINRSLMLFRTILHQYLGITTSAPAEEKRMRLGLALKKSNASLLETLPYLGLLLDLDYPETKHLPPAVLKKRIIHAVIRFLHLQTEQAPVLLLIDDLQWSDPSSLEIIDHLVNHAATGRMMIAGLYRSDYNFPWIDHKNFQGLILTNLDRPQTGLLAGHILKTTRLPENLTALIHEKSQGNPLFIGEIVKLLIHQDAIRRVRNEVRITDRLHKIEIAESVSSVILDQIDRLPESGRRLLQYASVLGRNFSVSSLTALMKSDAASLGPMLERLVHFEGLLARRPESDEYEFTAPTTHEAVYSSLLKARRRELHFSAGLLLESVGAGQEAPDIEALAYHFSRAADVPRGTKYLKAAADRSYRLYALKETAAFLEQLLDLLSRKDLPREEMAQKVEALYRLGWIRKLLGEHERARRDLNQSLRLGRLIKSPRHQANAMINLGIVYLALGQARRGLAYFQRSLPIAASLNDRVLQAKALQNIGSYYLDTGQWEKAQEYYHAVFKLYELENNPQGMARVNYNLGIIYRHQGKEKEALENLEKARTVFQELGDKDWLIKCDHYLGLIMLDRGEIRAAAPRFENALAAAVQIGDQSQAALMLGNLGLIHALDWNLVPAREKFAQSLAAAQTIGDLPQIAAMESNIGDVHLFQGDLPAALKRHLTAIKTARQCDNPLQEAISRRSLAWDYYYQGELTLSRQEFQQSAELYEKINDRRNAVISQLGLAMLNRRLNGYEKIRQHIEEIEAKARARRDLEILTLTLDIKADYFFEQKDRQAVKTLSDELFQLCRQTNNKRLFAWATARLAWNLVGQDNIEAGQITMEKANALSKSLGDKLLMIYNGLISAVIAVKTGQTEQAKDLYISAWQLAQETTGFFPGFFALQWLKNNIMDKKKQAEYRKKYRMLLKQFTSGLSGREKKHLLKTLS